MRKQTGRSMIEMLGVLAIIGVLSIGGLLGYRRAVNNHQANTILDDANRLAFVITERDNFAPNDNITNVEFNQTSTYSIVPFVGEKARQYGIMVENVPKGVCEALVPKAAIEYKVRVTAYKAINYLDQETTTGLVYDSFHKDICINDMNDVILYFGDTSAQCNKPEEGEDYAKCNSNADCCGTHFCAFLNPSGCYENKKGEGKCKSLESEPAYPKDGITTSDGKKWIRSGNRMNWWTGQNWCKAMGMQPVTRKDIDCFDEEYDGTVYDCSSPTLTAIQEKWGGMGFHWLEQYNSCDGLGVHFAGSQVYRHIRHDSDGRNAFCH